MITLEFNTQLEHTLEQKAVCVQKQLEMSLSSLRLIDLLLYVLQT